MVAENVRQFSFFFLSFLVTFSRPIPFGGREEISIDPRTENRIEEAVADVLAGQRERFQAVLAETLDILTAYATFFVTDSDLIDDILQEAYIRMYEQLDTYESGTSFIAWSKTIVKYIALTERSRIADKKKAHKRYSTRVRATLNRKNLDWEEQNVERTESDLAALKCLGSP